MKQVGLLIGLALVGMSACLACVFGSFTPESDAEVAVLTAAMPSLPVPPVITMRSSADCWRSDDLDASHLVLELPASSLELNLPTSPRIDELLRSRTDWLERFDLPVTYPFPTSNPEAPALRRLDLPVTRPKLVRRESGPPEHWQYPLGPFDPSPPVRWDFGIRVWLRGPGIVFVRSPRLSVSNVVLAFEDGTRQRYEDLEGSEVVLAGSGEHANKRLITVWVKAGPNFSGDGPGYGQRFDLDNRARPRR